MINVFEMQIARRAGSELRACGTRTGLRGMQRRGFRFQRPLVGGFDELSIQLRRPLLTSRVACDASRVGPLGAGESISKAAASGIIAGLWQCTSPWQRARGQGYSYHLTPYHEPKSQHRRRYLTVIPRRLACCPQWRGSTMGPWSHALGRFVRPSCEPYSASGGGGPALDAPVRRTASPIACNSFE